DVAMGYWDEADLPFYYSLARTFPLANRWFASAPCQTYPNRRFLQAATAWGLVSTTTPGPNDAPPPNGTIFDRLSHYGLDWKNYVTGLAAHSARVALRRARRLLRPRAAAARHPAGPDQAGARAGRHPRRLRRLRSARAGGGRVRVGPPPPRVERRPRPHVDPRVCR